MTGLTHCDCCLLMLWEQSLGAILSDSRVVDDMHRQRDRNPTNVTAVDFLRECAWAIFNAGMSYKTVSQRWAGLQAAFHSWDARLICQHTNAVRAGALRILGHKGKVDAVIEIAQSMDQLGWDGVRVKLLKGVSRDSSGNFVPSADVVKWLEDFSWIGRANSRYILKNCGYDLAKPDVHLERLAKAFGFGVGDDAVQEFAARISGLVDERVGVVETALWNACQKKASIGFKCPSCGAQR